MRPPASTSWDTVVIAYRLGWSPRAIMVAAFKAKQFNPSFVRWVFVLVVVPRL
jgi:hypothetical protein